MPSQPVARTPSFIPSVYPYEITFTLSTETPTSTLKLPQYQAARHQTENHAPDANGQTESIQDPEPSDTHTTFSSKSRGDDMKVINSKEVHSGKIVGNNKAEDVCKERSIVLYGTTSQKSAAEERFQDSESQEGVEIGDDDPLPIFQEKAIYRQGKFKWSVSFGLGPIDAPPPPNQLKLSEGDVFIRVNTNTRMRQTQVWFLSSKSSILVWKAIVPLRDIRYIGGVPYVLCLKVHEPSWILARSAAHPQMSSGLNGSDSAQHKRMQENKQTSSSKRQGCAKGKAKNRS